MVPMTAPSNYFCTAKITEAILNKIKVCGTFIVKFRIEIHLLKDDSWYHENKWHSLGDIGAWLGIQVQNSKIDFNMEALENASLIFMISRIIF